MSNIATKIAIYSLLINLAAGIMLIAIVDVNGTPVFNKNHQMGVDYDTGGTQTNAFTGEMGQSIKPGGELEDQGNQIYRILDTISLGFVARFVDTLGTMMYGFVKILRSLFAPFMSVAVEFAIFGALNTLLTIAYILAAIKLFTGKDLIEGT